MGNRPTLESNETKLNVLRLMADGHSARTISKMTGVPRSTIGDFIRRKNHKEWWDSFDKSPIRGQNNDHHTGMRDFGRSRYIITSAQNNTFVHQNFLSILEHMASDLDAMLMVGTYSYNKSGFQNLEKGDGEWFDHKIMPYIGDEPIKLADSLIWCGEMNILPTAVNPLSGLKGYTKACSGIFPHAKVQMESVPTHKSQHARMMYTTGTVTKRNYVTKKAGQKASFHHVFGALMVEVDHSTGDWFVRQLQYDDETDSVQDLNKIWYSDGTSENKNVEAIVWGDIHIENIDEKVFNNAFPMEDGTMLNVLKPSTQVVHDVLSFEARNHHNIKDPHMMYKRYVEKEDHVVDGVKQMIDFLYYIKQGSDKVEVIESNHDLALRRWLREADYRNDPKNAVFFLECQLHVYAMIQAGLYDSINLLDHLYRKVDKDDRVSFHNRDKSVSICGVECGSHGDVGPNGSRGSINNHKMLESKYVIGHSHTAGIKDGVYQVGHSMDIKKVEYAQGPSSWSHTHCLIYPNGKRTLVTMRDGRWKL